MTFDCGLAVVNGARRTIHTAVLGALFLLLLARNGAALTCKWQGNGGTWPNTAHWSCGSVPTSADDCIFGATSITASGQTIDAAGVTVSCRNLDFTGARHSPTFNIGTAVNVYGNLTLISGMSITPIGASSVPFTMQGSGTVRSAGQHIGLDVFGTYSLADDLISYGSHTYNDNTVTIEAGGGSLSLAGHAMHINNLLGSGVSGSIDLGTSTLTIADNIRWRLAWEPDTSTVEIIPRVDFSELASLGMPLNNLHLHHSGLPASSPGFTPSDVQIDNSLSVANMLTIDPDVVLSSSGDNTITTQTVRCTGTAGHPIVTGSPPQAIGNPTPGVMTFDAQTRIVCDYVNLHNTSCLTSVPCVAGAHSVDSGGNSNWCFGDLGACPTYTPTPSPPR